MYTRRLAAVPMLVVVLVAVLPVLDTLVLLCAIGIGPRAVHHNLNVPGYQCMRDLIRAMFASLPTAILQTAVYVQVGTTLLEVVKLLSAFSSSLNSHLNLL